MNNKTKITTVAIKDDVPELPVPLCFTEGALETLSKTVGAERPETGGFAFGPYDRFGIDTVEFDVGGSRRATSSVYAPDQAWAEKRRRFWLEQEPPKMLHAGVHSHPGDISRPSEEVGEGLGDLGFATAMFQANEALQYFAIPILTRTGSDEPRLFPWVAVRGSGGRAELYKAEARVCPASEFPQAVYNPAWEQSVGASERPVPLLDVAGIARMIEGDAKLLIRTAGPELVALRRGVVLRLELPSDFPEGGPRVLLPVLDGEPAVAPQNWRRRGKGTAEERIAKLIKETVKWLARAS